LHALSDPTRRSILERLGRGPATIGQLAEPFGLTLNGLKKHVGILEDVDLVITNKVGRARECRLGPAQLQGATDLDRGLPAHVGSPARQVRGIRREAEGERRVSHDLRFARLIDAHPEEVFDAFTEPGGQEAFYGKDDPGWIVQSQCDLRTGGVWRVEFGPSQSRLYRHRHVFQVIDRPRRIVLTTTEIRLDGSSFDTELEFMFQEQDGKTLMTMVHRGFPSVELRDEHRVGLPNAFARLERAVLAGR
jgi:uncharacterized protein YndB with AHSA1/START domain